MSRILIGPANSRESLPPGGSVLDVGCGAGAASLRLRPGQVVGVDSNRPLVDAFAGNAARLGIPASAVEGTWPRVAEDCPAADVVVCHHVFYNVADLAAFAAALDTHAHARVVVELTAAHPMAWMAPCWLELHGRAQPDRPTADDAVAVLAELGLSVHPRHWARRYRMIGEHGSHNRRRRAGVPFRCGLEDGLTAAYHRNLAGGDDVSFERGRRQRSRSGPCRYA